MDWITGYAYLNPPLSQLQDVLTYLFMVSSHSGPIQSNLKLFRSQFNQDTDNSIPSHSDPINIK